MPPVSAPHRNSHDGNRTEHVSTETGAIDHFSETLRFYAMLEKDGEKGALQVLRQRLQLQADSPDKEEGELAQDTKETIVLKWRTEFPKAAVFFDSIADLNRGLMAKPISNIRFGNPYLEEEELLKVAERELWFVIPDYDSTTGNRFSTLAVLYIQHGLANYVRSRAGRTARRESRFRELDAPFDRDGDGSKYESTPDARVKTPLQNLLQNEQEGLLHMIREAIRTDVFTEQERTVLSLRFEAVAGEEEEALDAIGKRYRVTRERIRQVEAKALKKLAELFRNADDRDVPSSAEEVAVPQGKKIARPKLPAIVLSPVPPPPKPQVSPVPLKVAIGIDLSTLTPEERLMIAYRIEGKVYDDIAELLHVTTARVNKVLTRAYKKLDLHTRRHPKDDLYKDIPPNAAVYSDRWDLLTSYQRCVASLDFQGKQSKEIAEILGFTASNVRSLLSDARRKLGIDATEIPQQYRHPPAGWQIRQPQWDTLTPLEKMVAYETLRHPKKSDEALGEELRSVPSSIATVRSRARKKLDHLLQKMPQRTRPKNAEFALVLGSESPPEGFAHLEKIWGKLTPRQQAVLYRSLQNQTTENIMEELGMSRPQFHGHHSRAMKVVQPLLSPQPEEKDISKKKWNALSLNEQRVVRVRLEHPDWSARQIAASALSTEEAVRGTLCRAAKKLEMNLSKRAAAQYNMPPHSNIPVEAWNRLQPRHLAVAWESLAHSDLGPADIVALLGIEKKTHDDAIKYVKELRREAGHILGLRIRKQTSCD